MTFEQPKLASHVLKQCTDAATDKLMNANFGGSAQQKCAKQEMHKTGGTIVVDSVCSFAGMTTQSHAVITGSFNSAYKMDVTTRHVSGPAPPGAGRRASHGYRGQMGRPLRQGAAPRRHHDGQRREDDRARLAEGVYGGGGGEAEDVILHPAV
ncbi:MAG: hypothetical protein P8Z80_06785, partial [Pseudolabrys sp.]